MPVLWHALAIGHAQHFQFVTNQGVQRRRQLHGFVDLGQDHALALRGAPVGDHVVNGFALGRSIQHQEAADAGVREHLQQLASAAVALGHASGVDQHHALAREQVQQVFQRGAVMRGVHRHAQDAAIGAQLLMGTHAIGVQRDQA